MNFLVATNQVNTAFQEMEEVDEESCYLLYSST